MSKRLKYIVGSSVRDDATYLVYQTGASVVILGHIPVNAERHEKEHDNFEDYA